MSDHDRLCAAGRCGRIADMAVQLAPRRGMLTIYVTIDVAPSSASPFCAEHGAAKAIEALNRVLR